MRRGRSTGGRFTPEAANARSGSLPRMDRRGPIAAIAIVAVVLVGGAAVLAFGGGTKTLSEAETRDLLGQLPYEFEFREVPAPDGASGAVAGQVVGPHHTVVRFGVSLGRGGSPVSLGPHTDLADATGGETFRVTSDDMLVVDGGLVANPRLRTAAQWNESARMIVAIEGKLCRATEGEPCAI